MILYHGTDIFSARNILENGVDLLIGRADLDFGQGFYMIPSHEQALNWACNSLYPCVLKIEVDICDITIKKFQTANKEWATFVVQNRLLLAQKDHAMFDCIDGPMADAGVSKILDKLRSRKISIEQAIKKIVAKPNGWQFVIVTYKGLDNIRDIRRAEER